MTGWQIPCTAGQQFQAIVQPGQDRLGRQELDAGRGQLQGERQPVETAADLGDGGCVFVCQLEVGFCSPCALEEELHGFTICQILNRRVAGWRQVQWRNRIFVFPTQVERDAAADQDLQLWRSLQKVVNDRCSSDELFEVVQNE